MTIPRKKLPHATYYRLPDGLTDHQIAARDLLAATTPERPGWRADTSTIPVNVLFDRDPDAATPPPATHAMVTAHPPAPADAHPDTLTPSVLIATIADAYTTIARVDHGALATIPTADLTMLEGAWRFALIDATLRPDGPPASVPCRRAVHLPDPEATPWESATWRWEPTVVESLPTDLRPIRREDAPHLDAGTLHPRRVEGMLITPHPVAMLGGLLTAADLHGTPANPAPEGTPDA